MSDSRNLLASASYDQTIRLWDAMSEKAISTIPHAEAQVNTMSFVPKSCQLAVGTWQKVRLFDVSPIQPVVAAGFDGVNRNITAVGFEPHARWMFTGGDDFHCRVFDVRGTQLLCQRAFEVSSGVTTVVLHCNQVELFLADQSGYVYVWDLSKPDSHDRIACPKFGTFEFVVRLTLHPSGRLLAGITNRGTLITWTLSPRELKPDDNPQMISSTLATVIDCQNIHNSPGLSLRYTPDGRNLVITFADTKIVMVKTDDYTSRAMFDGGCDWNWDVHFTCDSRMAFIGGSDSKVKMWDMETQKVVRTFDGHQKPITAFCITDNV